jgi:hypothetical protein
VDNYIIIIDKNLNFTWDGVISVCENIITISKGTWEVIKDIDEIKDCEIRWINRKGEINNDNKGSQVR